MTDFPEDFCPPSSRYAPPIREKKTIRNIEMTRMKQNAKEYAADPERMLPWLAEKMFLDVQILQYWIENTDDRSGPLIKTLIDNATKILDRIEKLRQMTKEKA